MSERQPASQRAEESVIGALLRSEETRMEVLGSTLEPEHFYYRPYRAAFLEIQERYYADDPIDALTVAEAIGPQVSKLWGTTEREAIDRIIALAKVDSSDLTTATEHAKIIKRHADYRALLEIAANAVEDAIAQERDPEEIAGVLSAAATRVVTGSMLNSELLGYADLGRRWVQHMREGIAARQAGVELGAFYGIKAIDDYVKGQRPTELFILGGDPGVGKSAIAWAMARNFALRQMKKPPDKRVGVMIWSAEMGEELSSTRFAQAESRMEGERLRLGTFAQAELREIAQQWAAHRDLPLWVNHSGELRETQLKALVVDAVHRHNVGVLIIDHFRFIKTDERFENKNDADDQIVKFLKSTLAKDLNLAVVCLAHTTKGESARRPVMDDLRGSKMISAFADIVAFPYSPWRHASQEKREKGLIARQEYELIFDKVRQGAPGTADLWMDLSTMVIR